MERTNSEYMKGVMAGRNAQNNRLYQTIDDTLTHLADQLAEGRISEGEYKVMEATALYILHKTKEARR